MEEEEIRVSDEHRAETPFSATDIGTLGRGSIMAPRGRSRTLCLPLISEDRHEDAARFDCTAKGRAQGE